MRCGAAWRLGMVLAGVVVLAGFTACTSTTSTVKTIPIPTATTSVITITLDHARYSTGQALGVTLTNGSGSPIYALDGYTACTFLQLQEYDLAKDAWRSVLPCTTGEPSQARLIPIGAVEPFTVAPGNAPGNANQWDAGVYRVAFVYSAQSDGRAAAQTIYSQGFQIKASS